MEVRGIAPENQSKEVKEKLQKQKEQKEEISKAYGDYLISVTESAFDKCIQTDSINFSKSEKKCIERYFHKIADAHQIAYKKFQYINKMSDNPSILNRAKDYGDFCGMFE